MFEKIKQVSNWGNWSNWEPRKLRTSESLEQQNHKKWRTSLVGVLRKGRVYRGMVAEGGDEERGSPRSTHASSLHLFIEYL